MVGWSAAALPAAWAARNASSELIPVVPSALGHAAGIGDQHRDHLPPHWSEILPINDVAVVQRWHKHAGVRRHLAQFGQHRPQISLRGMHGASAGHARMLRDRQAWLGTLHRHRGMGLERFRNESEKTQQSLTQCGSKSVIGVGVIAEER